MRWENGARLTLSSKKDAYYTVTQKGCFCKGFTYRRTCKHIKELEGSSSRLFSNLGVRFNLPEECSTHKAILELALNVNINIFINYLS